MLGIEFKDKELLCLSLTHSSLSAVNNERIEFLGDAVIGMVIAELLMEKYPKAAEGKLSRWRSTLVSRKTLADCAIELGLGKFLLLGKGEESTGGREKTSILAGTFEAVIGAVYLDQGFEVARRLLKKIFEGRFLELEEKGNALWKQFDQKTHLQEKTQSLFKSVPFYRLVDSWGLQHEKSFRVTVELDGKVIADGVGKNKKEAEQSAAEKALSVLEENV